MQKIIILGKTASRLAESVMLDLPDSPFIVADTITDAREWLDGGIGSLLLMSRDTADIDVSHLIHLLFEDHSVIIWPPDSLLDPLIRHLASNNMGSKEDEPGIERLIQGSEVLIRKNQELTTRITALEGVVRSLLSALNQSDPSIEAYAGEEDAWKLIIRGLPAAGLPPEDYSEEGYDGNDDDEYGEEEPLS